MRVSSRYIFSVSILIILLAGVSILLQHQGFALKLFIISFWMLVLGVILYVVELKNED